MMPDFPWGDVSNSHLSVDGAPMMDLSNDITEA